MNEHLLQYIWMHRLYDASQLETIDHQPVKVIYQGQLNKDQGPDFLHARIRINDIELIGSVEIHMRTSNWRQHKHTGDIHYRNVVLHTVWEHDADFDRSVPILVLKGRVPNVLLTKYRQLSESDINIPCSALIAGVPDLVLAQWKDRMMAERLEMKSEHIQKLLTQTIQNEEAVFWQMMFRNMGLPVNADGFEAVFRSIPLRIIGQCAHRIQLIEALLLGQAGLLDDIFGENYLILLQKEYSYLQRKYGLKRPSLLLSYLRMRPAHFPVIRLAQLAMLIHTKPDLYRTVLSMDSIPQMKAALTVRANDFWHLHYSLKRISSFKEKQMGDGIVDIILINTVLPFRYLLALRNKNADEQMKVSEFYFHIRSEQNKIVKKWKGLGVKIRSAFDTQSVMHLWKNYCTQKRCLQCAIGHCVLKQ